MSKQKFIEAEIILPKDVLQENPSLAKHYEEDTNKLLYIIDENITEETVSSIEGILKESSSKEIVALNPLIKALMDLQEIKDLKYENTDPKLEKESVQKFKDAKKVIGSFNTALTSAKALLKAPHIEYGKKVDNIYNLFKQESDNVKNALTTNFDEHLKNEEKKKKEKEDKIKSEELKKIEELTEANKEASEKLKNQEKQSALLEITNTINKVSTDITTAIPNLNTEGLESLKSKLFSTTFSGLIPDDKLILFEEEEIESFKNLFKSNYESSMKLIVSTIDGIKNTEEIKTLQAENKVLEAQTPKSFDILSEDLPDIGSYAQWNTVGEITDLDKIRLLVQHCQNFKRNVDSLISNVGIIDFQEPWLVKQKEKIVTGSFPKLKEWSDVLVTWTSDKLKTYEEAISKNS